MDQPGDLKLIAEDSDDLNIISAALQDAVCRVEDLVFEPRRRRFVCELNRFRWERVTDGARTYERVRSGLSINGVLRVRARHLPKPGDDAVLSILSLNFTPDSEPPGGVLGINFAGGGEMSIAVECIDITLLDTSRSWPTRRRPDHGRDD